MHFMGRMGRTWSRMLLVRSYRNQLHPTLRTVARMIRHDFRMHYAGVFLFLLMLVPLLMIMILLAGRAIEVNRAYLGRGGNRERHGTGNNESVFVRFGSHVFCGGSRVVTTVWTNADGTAAATAEDSGPRKPRGSLGQKWRCVSAKAPLQD